MPASSNPPSIDEAKDALRVGDYGRAKPVLEALAGLGSKPALVSLGTIYLHGNADVPQDLEKARYWYERGLNEGGSDVAAARLGRMYYLGLGVPTDLTKAFGYYSKVKGNALPEAHFRLGVMYQFGLGVQSNADLAIAQYKRGARGGNYFALRNLGMLELKRGRPLGVVHLTVAFILRMYLAATNQERERLARY